MVRTYRSVKRVATSAPPVRLSDGAVRYLVEETRAPTVFPVACLDVDGDDG
ncbi:MAG: hypothetical protein ABGY09_04630 [Euryarchaeota archaeon]